MPVSIVASQSTAPSPVQPTFLSAGALWHDPHPWKYSVLSKLHGYESVSSEPHAGESLLVSKSAAMFARSVLDEVDERDLPVPIVCPVSGEGLGIIWTVGSKQLEALFASDDTGSYVLAKNEEVLEAGDLSRGSIETFKRALSSVLAA